MLLGFLLGRLCTGGVFDRVFVWLVWCCFAHSLASMLSGNAWKRSPPNSDNSCLGAPFPLVPLWTALKTTSKSHAFYALATSMLGSQSSLFQYFWLFGDAFGVVVC